MMAQFPTAMNGGPNMWAITSEERTKHDKQFDNLKPSGGYITGDQARTFFLQSGLPAPVLAEIWALSDLNKDGKMDQQEFSIAMKLIKLKLQGQQLPVVLPPIMKQPPMFSPLISARFGMGSMPNLSIHQPLPPVAPITAPLSSATSGTSIPPLMMPAPLVPSVSTSSLPNGTASLIQPLSIPYSSSTLPHASSYSLMMGGFGGASIQKAQSLIDLGSSSSTSSTASLSGNSPKTGTSEWAVPQPSRLKYRQKFNSLDKSMSGYLSGFQARNALLQSNLSQTQLATIWTLADIDGDGQLKAEEFILAMHLTDMAKAGQPLPLTLPPELVPPSFRGGKQIDSINGTLPSYQKTQEEEPQKKLPVTFEDKRKANYERGNMELEKRRQVLMEQQQREAERKAQKEKEEWERKQRELQEQEWKKQLELEKRLEKQRELERHETDINLEVSFAEQAVNQKELSKERMQKTRGNDASLPSFRLPKDKTGTTRIGDLAPQDMKKVCYLSLIELTALYDVLGVELKQQKAVKIKTRDSGLFGIPLTILLEQDQRKVPGTRIPLIFQKLISCIEEGSLETEGLLRIPGAAMRVKNLCQELEAKFYEGTFNWESVKQHDAASLLKLFLRELPQPLLSTEYLKAFQAVQNLPTKKEQLQALNLLVILLPDANRDTLKALLEFLQRVIDNKEKNKMTAVNVAMVMAPNLFMCHALGLKSSEHREFEMAAGTANTMHLLIRYQKLLWTIPKFIVNQVRKHNTAHQKKERRAMKKLLKKMAYDREKHEKQDRAANGADVPQGVIRVQAPHLSKVSMAIQLTEELKASDVLARFLSQESGVAQTLKKGEVFLYEIGGNIGERCLDDDTYMKDLYHLNPNAEWVIKSKPV